MASEGYRRFAHRRLFRGMRATEIYQGTSEAQRMILAEPARAVLTSPRDHNAATGDALRTA